MVLFDFISSEEIASWNTVNDDVMGGNSICSFMAGGRSIAVFSGNISLEHGGGFASVRSSSSVFNLRGYEGIELHLLGDGKQYKFNIRADNEFDGIAYQSQFETTEGTWVDIRIPFRDFQPVFRGRAVPNAPLLDLTRICGLGFLVSNKQAGNFRLEIDYVQTF